MQSSNNRNRIEINDKLLLSGIKTGDKSAFNILFNHFYQGLCLFAKQFVEHNTDAEGIVQDIFVSIWENRAKLEIKKSFKSYLFTSVKNRCLDKLKHKKIQEKYKTGFLQRIENEENYYDLFVISELREIINSSIDALPAACQKIFKMSRFDSMSHQQIADELNLSVRTVNTQISKAIKTLRVQLKDYLPSSLLISILSSL